MEDKKYLVLNKKQKRVFLLVITVFVLIVVPIFGAGYINYAINRPSQTFRDINYNLKSGQSLSELGRDLKNLGVINSENLFNIYVRLTRSYPAFKEGLYTFPSGSSMVAVVGQLKKGTNGIAITFIEGKRLEEYALQASKILPSFSYDEFIKKTKGMEGMLFPDTYFFYLSATEDDVIRVMKNNFEKKWNEVKKSEKYQNSSLTDKEIFILASLLEKESNDGKERQIIAGIILKRLAQGEILGIDASNQYLVADYGLCNKELDIVCPSFKDAQKIDWWKNSLSTYDLSIDSPYNLRIKTGLPPTPISSFSLSSLESALSPIQTEYLYYLHDKNGKIWFAKTLDEHNQNIQKYLQK